MDRRAANPCDCGQKQTRIGIVFGSASDVEKAAGLFDVLDKFEVGYEVTVISAHRTPDLLREYAKSAPSRGIKVLIAAAGLSAALPGVLASEVELPVIGLPIGVGSLNGLDALLAITQMPPGVPVASVGINSAKNAGLLALRILALDDGILREKLAQYKRAMAQDVLKKTSSLKEKGFCVWIGHSDRNF